MQMIEIKALENGAHNNQTWHGFLPDGWALIPDGMEMENFPFGEVEVKNRGGVMMVSKWTPGEIPEIEEHTEASADDVLNVLLGVDE